MNIVAWLVVGALVGWAASLVWHDLEGIVMNLFVSTTGASIGGWLLVPTVAADHVDPGAFSLVALAGSLVGALALLALVNLVRFATAR